MNQPQKQLSDREEESAVTHASLFSGIGGFDLAAEWMGWENVFQVEIDPFCTKVLEKNFPNTQRYGDIKSFTASNYIGRVDVLTGGFPCQPFSAAGKRKGTDDNRHLWPEMLRIIRIIKPTWIVAENVRGILSIQDGMVFEQVCTDLESEGYEVQPIIIPACAVNAPHRRDRIWFIAHNANTGAESVRKRANSIHEVIIANPRCEQEGCSVTGGDEKGASKDIAGCNKTIIDSTSERLQGFLQKHGKMQGDARQKEQPRSSTCDWGKNWPQVAAELCSVDDGIPKRMDRLKAYGNAIVPQVAYQIFNSIPL